MAKKPNSARHLEDSIRRLCGGLEGYQRTRRAMADVIVGQMIPGAVFKGGGALMVRYGVDNARFSMDLDAARSLEERVFEEELENRLRAGWNGFTGLLAEGDRAKIDGLPEEHVMKPYDVKLSYCGKSWIKVPLEVGFNEIGDADEVEFATVSHLADLFVELGFPEPCPIPLMKLEHQIAQKIHAVSSPQSQRAHDLIDLQVIVANGGFDMAETKRVCERLFAYRKKQPWPPRIEQGKGWSDLYSSQSMGLDALPTVEEAVAWANDFISAIGSTS